MRLSKKKREELKNVSVFEDVLKYYGHTFFEDGAPDTWSKDDTRMYDALMEVEERMRKAVLSILSVPEESHAKKET